MSLPLAAVNGAVTVMAAGEIRCIHQIDDVPSEAIPRLPDISAVCVVVILQAFVQPGPVLANLGAVLQ